MSITLILLVVALILFLLAAFGVPTPVNLTALGLAFVVLAQLVGGKVLG